MSPDIHDDPHARRAVPPQDAPALSLVLTSQGVPDALRALLAELLPDCAAGGVEVVVVRCGPTDEALAREHPPVRWVRPGTDAAPGALRSAGMAAAGGDVVMLAADDDPDAPARLRHLLRLYGLPGPPVEAGDHGPPRSTVAGTDDGGATRQRAPHSTEAAEDSTWHPRTRLAGGWTGSPRATGSSSSAPAPAA